MQYQSALKVSPNALHSLTKEQITTQEGREEFAQWLVVECLSDQGFFLLCSETVNFNVLKNDYANNDFSDPILGLLFAAMQSFKGTWFQGNPWPATPYEWSNALRPHLDEFFRKNPTFPTSFMTDALGRLFSLPQPRTGDRDRICDGLCDYILGVRNQQTDNRNRTADPASMHRLRQEVMRSIKVPGQVPIVTRMEDTLSSIFAVKKARTPFSTGHAAFDRYYGSKAAPGDAWLAFACPGGGKTNLACQTASHTAKSGKRVMFITTEVFVPTLLMRCCSSDTKIPYESLRTMFGAQFDHPHAREFSNWCINGPGKNLTCFDYREVAGADFDEKLMRMLDAYQTSRGAPPDMVILDWIGKAADSGFEDAWAKREGYAKIGNRMADLADELKGVTLTLAQANSTCKGRATLVDTDTADCKSLSMPFEGVIGITSLVDSTEGDTQDREVHRENQYLVICKCREEAALRLPAVRNFSVCKFD